MLEQLECIFMAKQETVVWILKTNALRERCPNTEFFLVRIFLYLFWMQENTDQKKLRIWTLFTQWRKLRQKKRKFEKSKEDDGGTSNQTQLKESTEDAEEM